MKIMLKRDTDLKDLETKVNENLAALEADGAEPPIPPGSSIPTNPADAHFPLVGIGILASVISSRTRRKSSPLLLEKAPTTFSHMISDKYFLSAKACWGILSRAEKREKEVPTILKIALLPNWFPPFFSSLPMTFPAMV